MEPERRRRAVARRQRILRETVRGSTRIRSLGVRVTWAMLWLINRATPVKLDAVAVERGLDTELHGEEAYLD